MVSLRHQREKQKSMLFKINLRSPMTYHMSYSSVDSRVGDIPCGSVPEIPVPKKPSSRDSTMHVKKLVNKHHLIQNYDPHFLSLHRGIVSYARCSCLRLNSSMAEKYSIEYEITFELIDIKTIFKTS